MSNYVCQLCTLQNRTNCSLLLIILFIVLVISLIIFMIISIFFFVSISVSFPSRSRLVAVLDSSGDTIVFLYGNFPSNTSYSKLC